MVNKLGYVFKNLSTQNIIGSTQLHFSFNGAKYLVIAELKKHKLENKKIVYSVDFNIDT